VDLVGVAEGQVDQVQEYRIILAQARIPIRKEGKVIEINPTTSELANEIIS